MSDKNKNKPGLYYVEIIDGVIDVDFLNWRGELECHPFYSRILAPVLSYHDCILLKSKYNKIKDENATLNEALAFYAKAENYEEPEYRTPHCHSMWETSAVNTDKGQTVRQAILK